MKIKLGSIEWDDESHELVVNDEPTGLLASSMEEAVAILVAAYGLDEESVDLLPIIEGTPCASH